MKPKRPGVKRPKKSDAPFVRQTKPASLRPAPGAFPILDGIGAPERTFPGQLLDNDHCIETHGRGLANMAERGGLAVEEIARNLRRLPVDAGISRPEAERVVSEALVAWWRG